MTAADLARARMVDALVARGRVRGAAVEQALRAVPRHLFLPGVPLDEAYADEAVAVQHMGGAATSSASQPSMVAIMLEQLGLAPGQRVLEIGAGTGYNAALLARIVGPAGSVTAMDIDAGLVASAAGHLSAAAVPDVRLVCGDGALGHPPGAPYDRIVLTVGSADVSPEWVAQLAPGGRLLVPLAVRGSQLSVALDLGPDGVLRSDSVRGCAFIRLRGIAAEADPVVLLPGGPALQTAPDGPGVDPAALSAALLEPGDPLAVPVPLGPEDVWDGFGLWLALTEPGTVRLLDAAGAGPAVALATPSGARSAGLAVVVPAARARRRARVPTSVAVRPFGPAGGALAARLLAQLDAWTEAGSPESSAWRIAVVPATATPPEPGRIAVRTRRSQLLLDRAP